MGKNKTFWAVFPTEQRVVKAKKYLTIVKTKNDALEYIRRKLILDHMQHYAPWCEIHKLNPNIQDTVMLYVSTVLTLDDIRKYSFGKITFNEDELSSLLRIVMGCVPVGCSYETPSEIQLSLLRLPKEKLEDLYQKVEEELSKGQQTS